jgi:uncharacterized protein DUF4157
MSRNPAVRQAARPAVKTAQRSRQAQIRLLGAAPALRRNQLPLSNHAFLRAQRGAFQPKPIIEPPNDRFEQEADRVAKQVMWMSGYKAVKGPQIQDSSDSSVIRRKCQCGGATSGEEQCEDCQKAKLLRKIQNFGSNVPGESSAPPIVHDVLRSPGRPLDTKTCTIMESHFGRGFSEVRVHTGAAAQRSAESVNAAAYTVGRRIVFGAGQYAPGTQKGRRLLAHELAHVVQQGANIKGSEATEATLEQDADNAEFAVANGAFAGVRIGASMRLSCKPAPPAAGSGVSLVEISCAANQIRFHTASRVVAYELTECDLDDGEYEARVEIDRAKRVVAFSLDEAEKGIRFRFNYLVGPDQPAPIELLRGQRTVHVIATNTEPESAPQTSAPEFAPDLSSKVKHITPEEAQRRCEANDLSVKTFPFRGTRFGAAPIDAWRDGPYIRVKQPGYVRSNSDFREQTRTLPIETFTSGIRLYPDEVVRVHVYEPHWYKLNITGSTDGDQEREFCVSGEQMLEIANASTNATIFNVGLTVFEAGTLFVPLGKLATPLARAGRTGLAATMIGTADVAPTALAGLASRAAVTVVEEQVEKQVVGQAIRQSVTQTVVQGAESQIVPRAAAQTLQSIVAYPVAQVAGAGLGEAGVETGAAVIRPSIPTLSSPVAEAQEISLSRAEYESALRNVFAGHYLDPVARAVDDIGQRAAQRAISNPAFLAAVQSGNRTLAGTLFHSAAAQEARAVPASLLPEGWTLGAEEVIQVGAGGSRADLLLRGPAGQIVEFDWKTTARSALSWGSRRQMSRHAGQITTRIGGVLNTQESRSWIDYVRPLLPDVQWR